MLTHQANKVNRTRLRLVYHRAGKFLELWVATPVKTEGCKLASVASYRHKKGFSLLLKLSLVGDIGFEPITSATSMLRSSQMS